MHLRAAIAVLVLTAACTSGPTTQRAGAPSPSLPPSQPSLKVLTVVEENHGAAAARRQMPFLSSLADTYGVATGYRNLTHPSLPNYLALAGGSTFAVHDDAGPDTHPLTGPSVFDAAIAAGHTARTYAEGMQGTCRTSGSGRYAVKHNPWAYFVDDASRRNCRSNDVPAGTTAAGALHDDLSRGTLPQVGLLVPDLCHDAHDCSLAAADRWLRSWVEAVMRGADWQAGRLVVVVTFDEDERVGGDDLLTVVASPSLHQRRVTTRLDHLSWCRWMTDLVGVQPLRQGRGATSLGAAFGLPR